MSKTLLITLTGLLLLPALCLAKTPTPPNRPSPTLHHTGHPRADKAAPVAAVYRYNTAIVQYWDRQARLGNTRLLRKG